MKFIKDTLNWSIALLAVTLMASTGFAADWFTSRCTGFTATVDGATADTTYGPGQQITIKLTPQWSPALAAGESIKFEFATDDSAITTDDGLPRLRLNVPSVDGVYDTTTARLDLSRSNEEALYFTYTVKAGDFVNGLKMVDSLPFAGKNFNLISVAPYTPGKGHGENLSAAKLNGEPMTNIPDTPAITVSTLAATFGIQPAQPTSTFRGFVPVTIKSTAAVPALSSVVNNLYFWAKNAAGQTLKVAAFSEKDIILEDSVWIDPTTHTGILASQFFVETKDATGSITVYYGQNDFDPTKDSPYLFKQTVTVNPAAKSFVVQGAEGFTAAAGTEAAPHKQTVPIALDRTLSLTLTSSTAERYVYAHVSYESAAPYHTKFDSVVKFTKTTQGFTAPLTLKATATSDTADLIKIDLGNGIAPVYIEVMPESPQYDLKTDLLAINGQPGIVAEALSTDNPITSTRTLRISFPNGTTIAEDIVVSPTTATDNLTIATAAELDNFKQVIRVGGLGAQYTIPNATIKNALLDPATNRRYIDVVLKGINDEYQEIAADGAIRIQHQEPFMIKAFTKTGNTINKASKTDPGAPIEMANQNPVIKNMLEIITGNVGTAVSVPFASQIQDAAKERLHVRLSIDNREYNAYNYNINKANATVDENALFNDGKDFYILTGTTFGTTAVRAFAHTFNGGLGGNKPFTIMVEDLSGGAATFDGQIVLNSSQKVVISPYHLDAASQNGGGYGYFTANTNVDNFGVNSEDYTVVYNINRGTASTSLVAFPFYVGDVRATNDGSENAGAKVGIKKQATNRAKDSFFYMWRAENAEKVKITKPFERYQTLNLNIKGDDAQVQEGQPDHLYWMDIQLDALFSLEYLAGDFELSAAKNPIYGEGNNLGEGPYNLGDYNHDGYPDAWLLRRFGTDEATLAMIEGKTPVSNPDGDRLPRMWNGADAAMFAPATVAIANGSTFNYARLPGVFTGTEITWSMGDPAREHNQTRPSQGYALPGTQRPDVGLFEADPEGTLFTNLMRIRGKHPAINAADGNGMWISAPAWRVRLATANEVAQDIPVVYDLADHVIYDYAGPTPTALIEYATEHKIPVMVGADFSTTVGADQYRVLAGFADKQQTTVAPINVTVNGNRVGAAVNVTTGVVYRVNLNANLTIANNTGLGTPASILPMGALIDEVFVGEDPRDTNWLTRFSDPTKAAGIDYDGDGLTDGEEYALWYNVTRIAYIPRGANGEPAPELYPAIDYRAGRVPAEGPYTIGERLIARAPFAEPIYASNVADIFNPMAPFADTNRDTDNDGISDIDEIKIYGTNPFHWDTDGDGLADGWEAQVLAAAADGAISGTKGIDPRIASHDGVSEFAMNPDRDVRAAIVVDGTILAHKEVYAYQGFNPNMALPVPENEPIEAIFNFTTGEEYNVWRKNPPGNFNPKAFAGYTTNPLNADTDNDSMPDGWELYVGLNPTNAADGGALSDFDEDLLPNALEYSMTIPGWFNKKRPCDPFNADTDFDGLTDAQEGFPAVALKNASTTDLNRKFVYGDATAQVQIDMANKLAGATLTLAIRGTIGGGCDPTNMDTDNDGMSDGWEYYMGSGELTPGNIAGMDPTLRYDRDLDFDHDGLTNYQEYSVAFNRQFRYDLPADQARLYRNQEGKTVIDNFSVTADMANLSLVDLNVAYARERLATTPEVAAGLAIARSVENHFAFSPVYQGYEGSPILRANMTQFNNALGSLRLATKDYLTALRAGKRDGEADDKYQDRIATIAARYQEARQDAQAAQNVMPALHAQEQMDLAGDLTARAISANEYAIFEKAWALFVAEDTMNGQYLRAVAVNQPVLDLSAPGLDDRCAVYFLPMVDGNLVALRKSYVEAGRDHEAALVTAVRPALRQAYRALIRGFNGGVWSSRFNAYRANYRHVAADGTVTYLTEETPVDEFFAFANPGSRAAWDENSVVYPVGMVAHDPIMPFTDRRAAVDFANFAELNGLTPRFVGMPLLGFFQDAADPNMPDGYFAGGPLTNLNANRIVATNPNLSDSDGDGMDDYYELFHALNPVLGDVLPSSDASTDGGVGGIFHLVGHKDWVASAAGGNPFFYGGEEITGDDTIPGTYDFYLYPWLTGLPSADPDGDGLTNAEEAVNPAWGTVKSLGTDPSPLWMTDVNNPYSFTNRFYSRYPVNATIDAKTLPTAAGAFEGNPVATATDVLVYAATVGLPDFSALPGAGSAYVTAFEINEGYDTDGDGIGDKVELLNVFASEGRPQSIETPLRRQAMYLAGSGVLQTPMSFNYGPLALRQFTIECWVKPDALAPTARDNDEQILIDRPWTYDNAPVNEMRDLRHNFRMGLRVKSVTDPATAAVTKVLVPFVGYTNNDLAIADGPSAVAEAYHVTTGDWTHLAATFDGKALTLYANGVATATVPATIAPGTGVITYANPGDASAETYSYRNAPLVIGAAPMRGWMGSLIDLPAKPGTVPTDYYVTDLYDRFYKGFIDEVRVWNGARAAGDISTDYTRSITMKDALAARLATFVQRFTTSGLYTDIVGAELIANFTFDEAFASTKDDQSKVWQRFPEEKVTGMANTVVKHNMESRRAIYQDAADYDPAMFNSFYNDIKLQKVANAHNEFVPWLHNTAAHLPVADVTFSTPRLPALSSTETGAPNPGEEEYTYEPADYINTTLTGEPTKYRALDSYYWRQARTGGVKVETDNQMVLDANPYGYVYNPLAEFNLEQYRATGTDAAAKTIVANDILPFGNVYAKYTSQLWAGSGSSSSPKPSTDDGTVGGNNWFDESTTTPGKTNGEEWLDKNVADGQTHDSDKDGMPDWWESYYGLDPQDATGENGPFGDPDKDGLPNLAEFAARSNPKAFSTAGSGVSDFDVALWNKRGRPTLGLLHTDSDYMEDAIENSFGNTIVISTTRMDNFADLDNDGWSNWAEIQYLAPVEYPAEGEVEEGGEPLPPVIKIEHTADPADSKKFPQPNVSLNVRYAGQRQLGAESAPGAGDAGGAILHVWCYSDAKMEGQATAVYQYPIGALTSDRFPSDFDLTTATSGHLHEGNNYVFAFVDENANKVWDDGELAGFMVRQPLNVGWTGAKGILTLSDVPPPSTIRVMLPETVTLNENGDIVEVPVGGDDGAELPVDGNSTVRYSDIARIAFFQAEVNTAGDVNWKSMPNMTMDVTNGKRFISEEDIYRMTGGVGLIQYTDSVTNVGKKQDFRIYGFTQEQIDLGQLTATSGYRFAEVSTRAIPVNKETLKLTSPIGGTRIGSSKLTVEWTANVPAVKIELLVAPIAGGRAVKFGPYPAPAAYDRGEGGVRKFIYTFDQVNLGDLFADNANNINGNYNITVNVLTDSGHEKLDVNALSTTINIDLLDHTKAEQDYTNLETAYLRAKVMYNGVVHSSNAVNGVNPETKAGMIIQAFDNPAFSGAPLSQASVSDITAKADTCFTITADPASKQSVSEVTLRGFTNTKDPVYLMGWIDLNGNGIRDAHEPWGYCAQHASAKDDYIYAPKSATPVRGGAGIVSDFIIRDVDSDNDRLADAWEWINSGFTSAAFSAYADTFTGTAANHGDAEKPSRPGAAGMIVGDYDGDGVSDYEESLSGTNASSADRADGLTDRFAIDAFGATNAGDSFKLLINAIRVDNGSAQINWGWLNQTTQRSVSSFITAPVHQLMVTEDLKTWKPVTSWAEKNASGDIWVDATDKPAAAFKIIVK